MMQMHMIQIVW